VSHNGARGQKFAANASGDCGRHYFSERGLAGTWRVALGLPASDLGGCIYQTHDVPFCNADESLAAGTCKTFTFWRRERPHVVLGPDGFTPVAITVRMMLLLLLLLLTLLLVLLSTLTLSLDRCHRLAAISRGKLRPRAKRQVRGNRFYYSRTHAYVRS